MDCHNAHHIVILACGIGLSVVYLVFLLYIYVPDKPGVGAELDWDLINENCHSYRCQSL